MLEYILIHVLIFADWWVKPQINQYTRTHYVAYPMFLWLLFYYGIFGILLARIIIKNIERRLPLFSMVLVLVWRHDAGNIQVFFREQQRRC